MSPGSSNGTSFTLSISGSVGKAIKQLHSQAKAAGMSAAFVAALKAIVRSLQASPTHYGDPYAELKSLGLSLYVRVESPLRVHYAVDLKRRVVYLQGVRPFPDNAFGPIEGKP